MAVTLERLCELYPTVYHMAYPANRPSLERHGFRSVSNLLELFEVNERERIVTSRRATALLLRHPHYGEVTLRDQKPLSESALTKCLLGRLTPADWYRILNEHIFFWPTIERAEKLLAAQAYRHSENLILEVSAERLLTRYWPHVRLSPINSGSTLFNPQPRGRSTLVHPNEYPLQHWQARRSARTAIAEIALANCVASLDEVVTRAYTLAPQQRIR